MLIASPVLAAPPDEPAVASEPSPSEPSAIDGPAEPSLPGLDAPSEPPAPASEPSPEAPADAPVGPASGLPAWNAPTGEHPLPPGPPAEVELPPPDGRGGTAVGAILLTGGLILSASSSVLIFEDDRQSGLWIGGAALGSLAVVGGIVTLVVGVARTNRYEPWQLEHGAPPTGTGLLASGVLTMSAGALGFLLGGISLARQDPDDLPYGEVLLSLGGVSIATGIALTVVGAKRRQRYSAWERSTFSAQPTFGVLPGPQLRPAGATFGIAGRF